MNVNMEKCLTIKQLLTKLQKKSNYQKKSKKT